jgi:hypothetical protein
MMVSVVVDEIFFIGGVVEFFANAFSRARQPGRWWST